MTDFHVAVHGSDTAAGTADSPFRTINRAAREALPGDVVTVHEGTYREWVNPRRGGLSDLRRITYQAAEGEHVVIKGSEEVSGWERDGDVWRTKVDNALFGDHNPFALTIWGDWLARPHDLPAHLGDVYLNGRSLDEALSLDAVRHPERRTEIIDDWTQQVDPIEDPDWTTRVWYAEVGEDATTIWANFGDADPNDELVEINVRRSVFFPAEHHVDWITVRGFEMAHAATPWSPPTADQPGLVGPNWAKGWIIEDNHIHDSKCSAVSLGKEASTGDNYSALRGDKPGYQYQLESVFSALGIGWDKERIGSHVVRRNHIHDCGQNAVVGHLGCVFSTIEGNDIHHIATRRQFYGYEIAGIKLHAAIDVRIEGNHIHDCSLGIWLDWQTQGTRLTRNVLHHNNRDLFIEVSHGPYLVDHNVFASPVALENFSQGGAYVANLFGGTVRLEDVLDRATPYHRPHSTEVAGYAVIIGGDDRFIGNVFADHESGAPVSGLAGTAVYDDYPASIEEYLDVTAGRFGDVEKFLGVKQYVDIRHNAYAGSAQAFGGEQDPHRVDGSFRVVVEDGTAYLESRLDGAWDAVRTPAVDGRDLVRVRFVDANFEDPDGRPARLDRDLVGNAKTHGEGYAPGPVANLGSGERRTQLWPQ